MDTYTFDEKQLRTVRAVIAGSKKDDHGYCACSKCGSRELMHDGCALDDHYIKCLHCGYGISGSYHYETIHRWNTEHRYSVQLKLNL